MGKPGIVLWPFSEEEIYICIHTGCTCIRIPSKLSMYMYYSVSCDGFGLVIHQSSGPSSQLCLNGTSLLMSHVAVNVTGQFTMSLWEK